MTYLGKIELLQTKLQSLDFGASTVFCTLMCYRLLPNYDFFCRECGFGKPETLSSAIDFAFQCIGPGNDIDGAMVSAIIEEVNHQTPDTEDFDSIFVSFALDACVAVLETLAFLKDKDFQHVAAVSTASTDTVHAFVQEKFGIEYEEADYDSTILSNQLVREEISFQETLIESLKQTDTETHDFLIKMRSGIRAGKSNIGL